MSSSPAAFLAAVEGALEAGAEAVVHPK